VSANIHKGSNNCPYHISKKPVSANGEHQQITFPAPTCIHDTAIICLYIGIALAETFKVGEFLKNFGRLIHGLNVKVFPRIARPGFKKWIFCSMQVIFVLPAHRAEPRMSRRNDRKYPLDGY